VIDPVIGPHWTGRGFAPNMPGMRHTPLPCLPALILVFALAVPPYAAAQEAAAAPGPDAIAEGGAAGEAPPGPVTEPGAEAAPLALPDPVAVIGQDAPVTLEGTVLIPGLDRRLARFVFPAEAAVAPETDAAGEAAVGPAPTPTPAAAPVLDVRLDEAGHRLLKDLYAAGRAAGNRGDLYDNRDRGHSRLPRRDHPQLAHVTYDAAAQAEELDYGLGDRMIFDAPTIGNSSTALTAGPFWRSQPRLALTGGDGSGPVRLFQNYLTGMIYVYPEHRDHDPERGDLIPANTPYMLISQGSSGSDRPHLEALAMTLAAFRPETKAFLHANGLMASTVQMVYRRSQTTVLSREAYLSGLAHPSVFDRRVLNPARMVALANAIAPGDVPPMVLLRVEEETEAVEGRDFFGADLSERYFDTPSAIARIWRGSGYSRTMVVSAEATRDPNGRPLAFTWTVLRGDPERTRIEVLNPEGTRARITVDWQDPRPVPGLPEITSARVDIGVFANNGVHDSAPAFVSLLLPRHETRVYETGPDGAMRIASIDHAPEDAAYADPALFPRMGWRDDYIYAPDGTPLGWLRTRDGAETDYDAEGRRVLTRGEDGSPGRVEEVAYGLGADRRGVPLVEERSTGRLHGR
jgi:hypothetical protein